MYSDYRNFFNIHDCNEYDQITIRDDFINTLTPCLLSVGCDQSYIESIGKSLFYSMIHEKVAYHTPIHVLSIINFSKNYLDLSDQDKLILFFHDAIYRPTHVTNEVNSADYMEALLENTGVSKETIDYIYDGIIETSQHLSNHHSKYDVIMDLDLSGFSTSTHNCQIQNSCIELEYFNLEKPSKYTEKEFLEGRIKFLNLVYSKEKIYKSVIFSHLEPLAKMNIKNLIKLTEDRLTRIK